MLLIEDSLKSDDQKKIMERCFSASGDYAVKFRKKSNRITTQKSPHLVNFPPILVGSTP